MIVALTGGTGVLGGAIAAHAVAAGHRVRALLRPRADRVAPALDGVTWIPGALDDPVALDQLVLGADAVVHCAFADTADPEQFVADNIVGSLRLLTRTANTAGRQIVFISSLAVYGPEPWRLPGAAAHPLDEDFALWPRDFYAAHKLALEKMVVAASGDLRLNSTAFRVGCVLGRYPDASRDHLARCFATARDHGEIREQFGAYVITAADAARVVVDALGDAAVTGQVINTFDRWLDFTELAAPLGQVLGGEIDVTCAAAPPPDPPIRNQRLLRRTPEFGTDQQIAALLQELMDQTA
jgi:nucleoside-diphosphate-sugar epimerase